MRSEPNRQRTDNDEQGFDMKRLLHWAIAIVLIAGSMVPIVWGAQKLQDPSVLPLKTVRVEGDFHYLDRTRLEQTVADVTRGGFFSVDVALIRKTAEQLPWVDQVRVRRVWPDTLRIEVTEQVPMAFWGDDGLLNVRGVVFRPDLKSFPGENFPHLSGPDYLSRKAAANYVAMERVLSSHSLHIQRLDVNKRHAWNLQLDGGLSVKLGSQDLEKRLSRFVRIYPRLVSPQEGELKLVDLRYTNGIAVERKPLPPESTEVDISQASREIRLFDEADSVGGSS